MVGSAVVGGRVVGVVSTVGGTVASVTVTLVVVVVVAGGRVVVVDDEVAAVVVVLLGSGVVEVMAGAWVVGVVEPGSPAGAAVVAVGASGEGAAALDGL